MMRPSIQIEKKIAFMPPSRMRGMSTCPPGLRLPRSKSFAKNRSVVSSCVSRTMEEKCSLRAWADISSGGNAAVMQMRERKTTERSLCMVHIMPQGLHAVFRCLSCGESAGVSGGSFTARMLRCQGCRTFQPSAASAKLQGAEWVVMMTTSIAPSCP